MLSGIFTVVFLDFVKCSLSIVLLKISGNAMFLPSVQMMSKFGNFIKVTLRLVEICILYSLVCFSV